MTNDAKDLEEISVEGQKGEATSYEDRPIGKKPVLNGSIKKKSAFNMDDERPLGGENKTNLIDEDERPLGGGRTQISMMNEYPDGADPETFAETTSGRQILNIENRIHQFY